MSLSLSDLAVVSESEFSFFLFFFLSAMQPLVAAVVCTLKTVTNTSGAKPLLETDTFPCCLIVKVTIVKAQLCHMFGA